jgi:hypothetical protein
VQLLVQVNGKDGSRGLVSDALENLSEIRSPESGLEAGANLAQPLSGRHSHLLTWRNRLAVSSFFDLA